MALYFAAGSESTEISSAELKQQVFATLAKLGPRQRVLALPPDITRYHSRAGELTRLVWEYYGDRLKAVMPALGTHVPMTEAEIRNMFGDMPLALFKVHDWREGLVTLGEVPGEYVKQQSGGLLDYSWPAQVDKLLTEGGFDLILSLGQVVPHEVIGMANYNKNVFVGTGGREGINKSHFLGAVYGMERIMGRADNPVRRVMNYASDHFATHLPNWPCAACMWATTWSASRAPPSSA
jgi:nickel-dependent lactate racemase